MKSFFQFSVFALMSTLFFVTSCTSEPNYDLTEETTIDTALTDEPDMEGDSHDHSDHPGHGYEDVINSYVDTLGVNLDEVQEIDFYFPDGSSEKRLLIEGDIVVTQEELEALTTSPEESELESRQWRTYNLINSPQVVTVKGYTGGGGYGLSTKMRTALQWAINNYNALNTGLYFSLSYGASTNAEIVVYRVPNGQAGGQAGFPSNGNPYKWVQIFSGMDNYDTNVIEHVITHEIGHSVGLRHTDWYNRISCGQNSNEGSGSSGVLWIPGTPIYVDWNSVMLACFSSNEDGEFGYYDKLALEILY